MSFTSNTPDWSAPDGYERIAIATYFYAYGDNGSENMAENEFADYRNAEGCYFIKEFPAEEFFTEKYKATYTTSGFLMCCTRWKPTFIFSIPNVLYVTMFDFVMKTMLVIKQQLKDMHKNKQKHRRRAK